MSDDIKAGDLVAIVRGSPCCGFLGCHSYYSQYTIKGFTSTEKIADIVSCKECGHTYEKNIPIAIFEGNRAAFVSMIKKVPPLQEDEFLEISKDKEITA